MNKVFLIGNMTKDHEVKYTTGEKPTAVCRFSIAVNSGYGDKKRTDYPTIVCFGKTAENLDRYTAKGSKVAISGKIQTGSYEKDGQKIYTTEVIADQVEFLTHKQAEDNPWASAESEDE